jgi:hypothetical protein
MKRLQSVFVLALCATCTLFFATSAQAQQPKSKKNIITISSEEDLQRNDKIIRADSAAVSKATNAQIKSDAELDEYIKNIDWEAERLHWLEWYGKTTEPNLTENKTEQKKPK